jgi:ABC-type transport system involved in multi-copper enzyme maturation permease subunit
MLSQRITQVYFLVFVIVQSIFLAALAPAYVAGSIAEEKERKTLEFLLATDLENREIVFGKLLSRLANLLLIFMVGIPILGILQFLGGVDPVFIVTWAGGAAVAVISLACLCMFCSVISRRPRDAIGLSYFVFLGYLIISGSSWLFLTPILAPSWLRLDTLERCLYVGSAGNPVAMAYQAGAELDLGHPVEILLTKYLFHFALFHLSVALLCCTASVLLLRRYALRHAASQPAAWFRYQMPRLPVFDNSMYWKELFVERGLGVSLVGRLLFGLLLGVSLAVLWYMASTSHEHGLARVLGDWIRVVGMLGACLLLLTVGGRAATSVSSERDRSTLDGLLTCPIEIEQILLAKWLGAVLSIRWGMFCLAVLYLIGIYAGAVQWHTLPLMALAWFVYAGTAAMLGVWYSVSCPSSASATIWTYLSSAGIAFGHWLDMLCMIPLFLASSSEPLRYLVLTQAGFTPPFALSVSFFFGIPESSDGPNLLSYGLGGLLGWFVIGVVLWFATLARFEQTSCRLMAPDFRMPPAPADENSAPEGGLAPSTNV